MTLSVKKNLSVLIVIITIISVNQWSSFPIGNTYTDWVIYAITTILLLKGQKYYYNPVNKPNLFFIKCYLVWICICIVRGLFVAEYYWDFKNLIGSSFALSLALSVFVFTNPQMNQIVLHAWVKYALPLFIVVILFIPFEVYGFYLIPISFFALFFFILPQKWRIIIFLISLIVIFVDFDARSNVVKFLAPLLFSSLYFFRNFLYSRFYKLVIKLIFIVPAFFLVLGISDIFNIFKMDKYISGTYKETKMVDGELREISLTADTRTFLYKEVIASAIANNYVLFGRTPARGNDSYTFGTYAAEELKTGRYERYSNEASILNVFTWTGLLGVVLYFLVFYKAAVLATTRSNNRFLKILGLYVAFRWMYAWVEDFNSFSIMNIMLWVIIAMCYSEQFRKMTDIDFKIWLRNVLRRKPYTINYKTNRALHRHSRI